MSRKFRIAITSRPLVGSSSIRFAGSCTSARARATLMRWPWEKPLARRSMKLSMSSARDELGDALAEPRVAEALQRAEVCDVLPRGQVAVETGRVRQHAQMRRARRRSRRGCRCPSMRALPPSGVSTPYSMRSVVDLPAPFGPSSPVICAVGARETTPRAPPRWRRIACTARDASIMARVPSSRRRTAPDGAARGRRHRALRVGGIEKCGHQPRHAAGRELAVPFAGEHQMAMAREAARQALGVRRRRDRIRLARQQQRRHVALQAARADPDPPGLAARACRSRSSASS